MCKVAGHPRVTPRAPAVPPATARPGGIRKTIRQKNHASNTASRTFPPNLLYNATPRAPSQPHKSAAAQRPAEMSAEASLPWPPRVRAARGGQSDAVMGRLSMALRATWAYTPIAAPLCPIQRAVEAAQRRGTGPRPPPIRASRPLAPSGPLGAGEEVPSVRGGANANLHIH